MSQQDVEKVLQHNGKRITKQRKILLDIILNGQWECCKEIYYEAVKRDPSIGMATVYRMMSTLEEIGVLERRCVFRMKEDTVHMP
ncbi:MAG TPA: transcriptional repressor [Candidatus Anaerostipes excrementavium]|mgnify:FL=1|uniref:Transcriptional repressor n=1 Tax=Candidatus Anaerostipes excrementavium TaxID=2838463 RepID=A0A9D1WX69_9FIRM|nr:transcriptional repressor [uncultured Anaerostipes sp.]HIX67700.1 transcriptional repressor [Candidatus Anaerostipes excrementavium]